MITHECKKQKDIKKDINKNYPRNGYGRRKDSRDNIKERREYNLLIIEMEQIAAVTDMLVALREDKDYHKKMQKDEVEKILKENYAANKNCIQVIGRCVKDVTRCMNKIERKE